MDEELGRKCAFCGGLFFGILMCNVHWLYPMLANRLAMVVNFISGGPIK